MNIHDLKPKLGDKIRLLEDYNDFLVRGTVATIVAMNYRNHVDGYVLGWKKEDSFCKTCPSHFTGLSSLDPRGQGYVCKLCHNHRLNTTEKSCWKCGEPIVS
jgi:hypothetical protein